MCDNQVSRVGVARHRIEEIAKALDIGIIERRIDFVENAERRRIGQKQGKDQRNRRQRLLAA